MKSELCVSNVWFFSLFVCHSTTCISLEKLCLHYNYVHVYVPQSEGGPSHPFTGTGSWEQCHHYHTTNVLHAAQCALPNHRPRPDPLSMHSHQPTLHHVSIRIIFSFLYILVCVYSDESYIRELYPWCPVYIFNFIKKKISPKIWFMCFWGDKLSFLFLFGFWSCYISNCW